MYSVVFLDFYPAGLPSVSLCNQYSSLWLRTKPHISWLALHTHASQLKPREPAHQINRQSLDSNLQYCRLPAMVYIVNPPDLCPLFSLSGSFLAQMASLQGWSRQQLVIWIRPGRSPSGPILKVFAHPHARCASEQVSIPSEWSALHCPYAYSWQGFSVAACVLPGIPIS